MKYILLALFMSTPFISAAQTPSLQGLIAGAGGFINTILIPAVLAIAFAVFMINAVRFFVIGGANEEGQKNAKALALYSVSAFVIIVSFWGLVNLLTNSIGLVNDPCTNYTTSDYIIRDSAPCASPRPAARPLGLIQPTPPTSLPSGVFPGPATPDGPDVTLPGDDPALDTTPPTSFTPDGSPIGDVGAVSYAAVQTVESTVRTAAEAYFTEPTRMEQQFGHNTNAVKSALFADLYTTRTSTVSDVERLTASYRLEILGAIPRGTTQDYLDTYNAYRATQGNSNSLTLSDIAQFETEPTPAIITNRDITRTNITNAIEEYNDMQVFEFDKVETSEIITNLYEEPDIDNRLDAAYSLYIGPQAIFRNNEDFAGIMNDSYIGDLNAELIFQGNFQLIQ